MANAHQSPKGLVCATSAFLIWGASPVYWKTLTAIPAFEILMHRIVWSFLFVLPLVLLQQRAGEFKQVLRTPRILLILVATTFFVSCNWLIFIWAVNSGYVLQTSLGYYINPLFSVLLGMVFLRERLRPLQILALLLAAAGVAYMTLSLGVFPWIALSLAACFGLYGLIRKVAPVGPLIGLTVETLILTPFALGYLIYLYHLGGGAFLRLGLTIDLLLMASALVTALPLLLFNLGAKELHLSTLGFLQYIVPSCFFLFAVFVFLEPISGAQVWTFIFIWTALAMYSADSVISYKIRVRTGMARISSRKA
ncbi:EamA family transporter RarD [Desulfoferrobacter suflitae]|uniref:EamA family transporter RarD n=1 Tax=Desulfoferrobacter suflitae TaxID=2865782 RepID=UPI00216440C5|nr:EamA family transporter RarD [Desulfoferrobacter suflitae]MCK8601610.1 EamA family transporter RarD [Desulfoferrobacter suflitae]